MSFKVGDRVVYAAHISNGPSGTSGSMAVDFRMEGTVEAIRSAQKQMQVAWECPPPIGVITVMVKMNDPAVSLVHP